MRKFEMNWFDYEHDQFKSDGRVYRLYENYTHVKLYTNFLFILNVHKPNYVYVEDIIDFIYHDVDIDKWPDQPINILTTAKWCMQKKFSNQFEIITDQNHRYMLT